MIVHKELNRLTAHFPLGGRLKIVYIRHSMQSKYCQNVMQVHVLLSDHYHKCRKRINKKIQIAANWATMIIFTSTADKSRGHLWEAFADSGLHLFGMQRPLPILASKATDVERRLLQCKRDEMNVKNINYRYFLCLISVWYVDLLKKLAFGRTAVILCMAVFRAFLCILENH